MLFDHIVFGPVYSRRLGQSLGINILPVDYKYCNYNCIYCECGWTKQHINKGVSLIKRAAIYKALQERFPLLRKEKTDIDSITFAGNGEPTIHPEFDKIIDDAIELRNEYLPGVPISVLSNSTMLHQAKVVSALKKIENNILKLDAGTNNAMQAINKPLGNLTIEKLKANLMQFKGNCIIQTIFLKGSVNGIMVDNTTDEEIDAYIENIRQINPRKVMLYPIDRATPEESLEKVDYETLKIIAKKINSLGVKTMIVY